MIKDSYYTASQKQNGVTRQRAAVRRDTWALMALFTAGLLTRLLFAGKLLYHWDSINFAFSLERFDVAVGQPHVPGYILYVALGRLVNLLFGDAQTTFVAISVVSSGLAAAALYLLGRDLFNRVVGLAAALFLLSSPLFWFYGEIALPHSLDTFVVILAVWLFYRLAQGEGWFATPWAVAATATWFAVAGGLRPQTEVFLLPLALYTAWRIGWRKSLLAAAVLLVVNLAWFIPLLTLNGGLSRYLSIMSKFTEAFNTTTSVFSGGLWGLARNARKLAMYTLYGWGAAFVPFALAAALWMLRLPERLKRRSEPGQRRAAATWLRHERTWVLALWILPTLAYYLFIHMGQQGLVFVYLPALLLLSAAALYGLLRSSAFVPQAALAGLVALNALVFVAVPTYPLGEQVKLLTRDTLSSHDASHQAILDGITGNFPEEHTLILASWWRFPQYYLPEYTLLHFDVGARWELNEGQGSLADETLDLAHALGVTPDEQGTLHIDPALLGLIPDEQGYYYLILFDEGLGEFNRSINRQQQLALPGGGRLTYLRFTNQELFSLSGDAFDIVPVSSGAFAK